MKRQIRQISVLPPVQRGTANIVPMSTIKGGQSTKTNVVGTALDGAITVERVSDDIAVQDTTLRFIVTETGKFKVVDTNSGYDSGVQDATSAAVILTQFGGLKITVAQNLNSAVADDICDVSIYGDSTYIVPGTILGRIKDENSDYFGKYEPVGSTISKYDHFVVCGGTIETNKQNYIAPVSDTVNNDDSYTVDYYVFAEVIESVCKSINLTDAIKAKINGIAWI